MELLNDELPSGDRCAEILEACAGALRDFDGADARWFEAALLLVAEKARSHGTARVELYLSMRISDV